MSQRTAIKVFCLAAAVNAVLIPAGSAWVNYATGKARHTQHADRGGAAHGHEAKRPQGGN